MPQEKTENERIKDEEPKRTALWWFSCGMATGLLLGIFITKMFFYAQV